MSYNALYRMKESRGLFERITAAAALEGIDNPEGWARANLWAIVTSPGWVDSWSYAEGTQTINNNPDIGARDDVVNDGSILSAVQARVTALSKP